MENIINVNEKTPNLSKNTGDNFGFSGVNDGSPVKLDGNTYSENNGVEWTSRDQTSANVKSEKNELKTDTLVPKEIARAAIKDVEDSNSLSGVNHG